jgi:chromosome segregation ATPase
MTVSGTDPSNDRWMGRIEQKLDDIKERQEDRARKTDEAAAETKRLVLEQNKQRETEYDALSAELRNVKHDQRGLEQKMLSYEERGKRDRADLLTKVDEVAKKVTTLEEPVKKLMEMRTRWSGIVMVVVSVVTVVGVLIEAFGSTILSFFVKAKGS